MERDLDTILGYTAKSISRAIDFMVDRAWFDLVALVAAYAVPESTSFSSTAQRVIFVLLFTLVLFAIRESLQKCHSQK